MTTEQLNQLIDPLKARHLPVESLPVLRGILYNGLHAIYIVAAAIILLALGVNWYDQAKRRGELRVAALADKSER